MADHTTDVGDRPELHDLMKALRKEQFPDEVEEDPNYPPFDEEQFETDYFKAQSLRGGHYGTKNDF